MTSLRLMAVVLFATAHFWAVLGGDEDLTNVELTQDTISTLSVSQLNSKIDITTFTIEAFKKTMVTDIIKNGDFKRLAKANAQAMTFKNNLQKLKAERSKRHPESDLKKKPKVGHGVHDEIRADQQQIERTMQECAKYKSQARTAFATIEEQRTQLMQKEMEVKKLKSDLAGFREKERLMNERVKEITAVVTEIQQERKGWTQETREYIDNTVYRMRKKIVDVLRDDDNFDVQEKQADFFGPISTVLLKDPVLTSNGQTYERSEIEEWFKGHNTDPNTNLVLDDRNVSTDTETIGAMRRYFELLCQSE